MNKKILSTVLSLLLIVFMAFTLVACGGSESSSGSGSSSGSPKTVVNAFFDSISKHDANQFLKCFEKDAQEMILENMDEDELEEELTALDEMLDEEYGKDWRKKVKVTGSEKVDSDDDITYYDVTVEFDGDEETMTVLKIKNKYYIDEETFEDFM